ncbi:glycosyltransferase family 4 protein [Desulfobacter latus]|uniref:Glycosyltransferase family 4 protein n=1 Tax=Desulfobacter latus TaxID=2292 RepID=A0A850STF4_9BACT|nr:glycosyltransferase family 4 protein [Desulfobacter latus]NWH04429.1 glycosyltransferase family 4 protein [Desulfobacter latus]
MKTPLYKIIHTTCHTDWGGLEKRILNESLWMADKGHQVIIIAPEHTPLIQRAKRVEIQIYPMAFKRLSALSDYRRLIRIFNQEKPHIVNTHGNTDSKIALPAAKKAHIPCRILSRHISTPVNNSWYNRLLYKKLSHYIFTTADYTRRHLQDVFNLSDQKIFSIPSGIVKPDNLNAKDEDRRALAAKLNLDPCTRFIGFAGRVSQDKGVETLLNGFEKAAGHIPHHLVIAGTGDASFLDRMSELARDLNIENRVHFIGFQENVWPFYRALDCKILPSLFEGIPQVLIEAMYVLCPVIGSRTGGIADIITHNETGLLFEVGQSGELSEMIIKTIGNPKTTIERTQNAAQKIKQYHTIETMGQKIIRIYQGHFK